tara:strand:+ start:1325 stop:1651 length:327 start_codon:yes stop_codon:yes gene_type:complete
LAALGLCRRPRVISWAVQFVVVEIVVEGPTSAAPAQAAAQTARRDDARENYSDGGERPSSDDNICRVDPLRREKEGVWLLLELVGWFDSQLARPGGSSGGGPGSGGGE